MAKKVLVLAHREELLAQAQRQVQRYAPHLRVSIERAKSWSDHDNDDVIIASVPTLGRCDSGSRLERFDKRQFKAIIIDEAHHSVARSYMRIMRHFGVGMNIERLKIAEGDLEAREAEDLKKELSEKISSEDTVTVEENKDLLVWGCSATLSRYDELALGSLFEKIVYHLDIGHLMREGWLSPAETREIYTDIDLKAVKMKKGDFDQGQLSLAIDTPTRNELIVAMWHQIAKEKHSRKATIVFALNVAHARNLAMAFEAINVTTALITGETVDTARQQILLDFMAGKIPVLINCAVLTEGTDLPITDCVVMTRPTCNSNLYTQMVGRGLRKHEGKDFCLVLDFIDALRPKMRSLITFPSLLAAKQLSPNGGEGQEASEKPLHRDINVDHVSIKVRARNSLDSAVSSPGHGLAWISLDRDHWALSSRKMIYLLELDPNDRTTGRLYKVHEHRSEHGRISYHSEPLSQSFAPVHSILPSFFELLKEMDVLSTVRMDSFWRRIRPMSDSQRTFLFRILTKIPGIDSTKLQMIHGWSVGRVSDLITKYNLRNRLLRSPISDFDDFIAGVEHYP